jgi:hypothetical protein
MTVAPRKPEAAAVFAAAGRSPADDVDSNPVVEDRDHVLRPNPPRVGPVSDPDN